MEIVRPVEQYPWPAIGSGLCVLVPLATFVFFCPVWTGHWEATQVAIWWRATIFSVAQCLPFHRWIATRGERSAEHDLQVAMAIALPLVADLFPVAGFGGLHGQGGPALVLLAQDASVWIYAAVICTSLTLAIRGGRRGRRRASTATT